ncbi:MAG TPA: S49 family peptidase [Verrucomicrobiae bacterium]|nr:S49 family peptidase [Verrucomicrobiae bacterium]
MNTFLRRLHSDIPLLTVQSLEFLITRAVTVADVQAAEHPVFQRIRADLAPKMELKNGIAIVPVQGALAYNPDPFEMLYDGVEDSRNVTAMINNAAANSDADGIFLRMDTPGGMMLGGPEIADAVSMARQSKPVVAHVGGLCCSLGYMIASQADEVIASRSAIVGSIGVIASVTDYSAMLEKLGIKFEYFTNKDAKFKGAGAIGTSLTDEQRAQLQSQVESAYGVFKSAVLSARPQVKPEAMQGQTFRGSEAKNFGLVDRIGDEHFALGVLRAMMKN